MINQKQIKEKILKKIKNMRCQANNCCDRDNCLNQMVRLKDIKKKILEVFDEEQAKSELNGR